MGKARARRPKRDDPFVGLRSVSKRIKATEAQWRNEFATREDVSEIVERYLEHYDGFVLERWRFRAMLPLRWLRRMVVDAWGWLTGLFARSVATVSDEEGAYGRSLMADPELDREQVEKNERLARKLEEMRSNQMGA